MNRLLVITAATMLFLSVATAHAQSEESNVVLINPFVVPENAIEETIAMWEQARDFLKDQPGYISTKLHRSLASDATYLLINVAQWESAEHFKSATALMVKEANLPRIEGVVPAPQLYTVIRD